MAKIPLCIIAGRSGSKRLPNKNLLPIAGKPMVAHSVEQALAAGIADVAISSDSPEILNSAKNAGANIIIKRPLEFATDQATSYDVIKHAIAESEKLGKNYDFIIFLQITSPLRLSEDIRTAMDGFANASSLLSVTSVKNIIGIKGEAKQINGSIYIWDKKTFLADSKHIYPDTRFLLMPSNRSIDIDYKIDYEVAKVIFESGLYKEGVSQII